MFFKKNKNPTFGLFLAHFPYFLGQKMFSQKIWHAELDKVSSTMPKSFKKAKSHFNDFWVGMVRNGCGH